MILLYAVRENMSRREKQLRIAGKNGFRQRGRCFLGTGEQPRRHNEKQWKISKISLIMLNDKGHSSGQKMDRWMYLSDLAEKIAAQQS